MKALTLTEQADALYDRLADERAEWRGHPVMYARLHKLCRQALARVFRRLRREVNGG